MKRFLGDVSIAKDNLLVLRCTDPFVSSSELIFVPRSVADGLVTALHIKLDHPTKHQLLQTMKRQFYVLDLVQVIILTNRVYAAYSVCFIKCYSRVPCGTVYRGPSRNNRIIINFADDVLRRCKHLIMILRETVSSYTKTCFIDDERGETLRSALIGLMVDLHPLDGPMAVVRYDPAPGFIALQSDEVLKRYRIVLGVGRVKNVNKNLLAKKAI